MSKSSLSDHLYFYELENHLLVNISVNPNFEKVMFAIKINFGSSNLSNALSDHPFYPGIAHFLEHMIFESEDMDISKSFYELDSSVNAYTSQFNTLYYFSTVASYFKPMNLLLRSVFKANFQLDAFQKEKEIIKREINMYQDEVEQTLYYDLLKLLYPNHPISIDIAGSEEDVQNIDFKMLNDAYCSYYHPSNATIYVSGNVNPKRILQQIKSFFETYDVQFFLSKKPVEADSFLSKHLVFRKQISTPISMVGFKVSSILNQSSPKRTYLELKYLLFYDHFLSKSSELVEDLLNRKWINHNFDFSMTFEKMFAYGVIYFESDYPEKVLSHLIQFLSVIKPEDMNADLLDRQKKKMIGELIQSFDLPFESLYFYSDYHEKGIVVDELIDYINNLTIEDFYGLDIPSKEELCSVIYLPIKKRE